MRSAIGQKIAAKRGERIMRERAERAHLADLCRFDSFGPEVVACWQAFLAQQQYYQDYLRERRDQRVAA